MKKVFFIFLTLFSVAFSVFSETFTDSIYSVSDSLTTAEPRLILPVSNKIDTIKIDTVVKFKPDPAKVIWMGAIIPGFGQILNKKYWKLPFVYGGFMGFTYAILWNNSRYNSYKNGYRDITQDNGGTSYLELLPKGLTLENYGGKSKFAEVLNNGMDYYHRYRDLSILLTAGYYGLVLLDAYVDAQLYDFDISPDLVLNVYPTQIEQNYGTKSAYGLQFSINF